MKTTLGFYSSIVSGGLFIFGHLYDVSVDPDGTVLGSTTIYFAHLLLIFVFTSIYDSSPKSMLGTSAMVSGMIGNIIVISIIFVEIAQASGADISMVMASPVLKIFTTYGPLLFVAGMVLLAISMIKRINFFRLSGYYLLAGTLAFSLGSVAGNFANIMEVAGSFLTGVGLINAGIKMAPMKK